MKIASGSRWPSPPTAAANACVLRTCRLTAGGETRRSATSTPAAFSPEIIARLIIRHPGAESRLATTGAFQCRPERRREPGGGLGRQVDVDEAGDAVLPGQREDARVSQIRFS